MQAPRAVENATDTTAAAAPSEAPHATAQADADTAAARELREIDRRLTAPDAVLEKDIFAVATGYLRHRRGQIKEVIQKLSDNFVGYPAMGSLCCEWLAMLDEPAAREGAAMSEGAAPVRANVASCCAGDGARGTRRVPPLWRSI